MVIAVNKRYSLHRLEPDTYSHSTYIFIDHSDKLWWVIGGSPKEENIEKFARSIKNGALDEAELYPRNFVSAHENWSKRCINEYTTAMNELPPTEWRNKYPE